MGLTEAWQEMASGVEYAVCPGTVAGRFDAAVHGFVNRGFAGLMADMTAALRLMFRVNRQLKVLLTVSPVPLTATASGQHVLTASSHSKALLRAVASELVRAQSRVDYFPSYEIITHPAYRGRFFAPNLRSVLPEGVDHVMSQFFRDQAATFGSETPPPPGATLPAPARPRRVADEVAAALPAEPEQTEPVLTEAEELRCEEEILAAFSPDQRHG
jgi:hypothetical protein